MKQSPPFITVTRPLALQPLYLARFLEEMAGFQLESGLF